MRPPRNSAMARFQSVGSNSSIFQYLSRQALHLEESQQERFESDIGVTLFAGQLLCFQQNLVGIVVQVGLSAAHFGLMLQFAVYGSLQCTFIYSEFAKKKLGDIFSFGENSGKQMNGGHSLLSVLGRTFGRTLYSLLCFDGKVVEIHIEIVFKCMIRCLDSNYFLSPF